MLEGSAVVVGAIAVESLKKKHEFVYLEKEQGKGGSVILFGFLRCCIKLQPLGSIAIN